MITSIPPSAIFRLLVTFKLIRKWALPPHLRTHNDSRQFIINEPITNFTFFPRRRRWPCGPHPRPIREPHARASAASTFSLLAIFETRTPQKKIKYENKSASSSTHGQDGGIFCGRHCFPSLICFPVLSPH